MLTRDDLLNYLGDLDRQRREGEDNLRRVEGAERLARHQLNLIDQREVQQQPQQTETPVAAAA